MSEVREVLREVRLTIGDAGDTGDRERQQARVKRMLVAMGVAEEDLDNELRDYKRDQEVKRLSEFPLLKLSLCKAFEIHLLAPKTCSKHSALH